MSGYVSKDQVIEWFRPYGHVDEGIPYYGLVTDIREMPDADVVPAAKWTFVSDGLPPEFESVLCLSEYSCRDENDEPKAMFVTCTIRRHIDCVLNVLHSDCVPINLKFGILMEHGSIEL